jgi:FkbM family methyltransferase
MSLKRLMQSLVRDLLPYARLDFRTPSGLHLFVPDRGAWGSLGEVFIARGYDPFYQHLNRVRHWVDLGCNHGFFSFGLLEHFVRQEGHWPETRAFLGDANRDCVQRVRAAIVHNGLQDNWRCEQVVVGPPDSIVKFQQHKDSIHSNIFAVGRSHQNFRLPATNVSAMLPPGDNWFDLIKIDIEGAEKFLFEHHLDFLKRFRYGLCEWHAPVFPGTEIEKKLRESNWRVLKMCSKGVEYDLSRGDSWESPLGVVLWENPAPAN